MIYITAVRLSTYGTGHEHISNLQWRDSATGKVDSSTRQAIVEFLNAGNSARVKDARGEVDLRVVNVVPPYVRTYADGRWTDNLLALPRF